MSRNSLFWENLEFHGHFVRFFSHRWLCKGLALLCAVIALAQPSQSVPVRPHYLMALLDVSWSVERAYLANHANSSGAWPLVYRKPLAAYLESLSSPSSADRLGAVFFARGAQLSLPWFPLEKRRSFSLASCSLAGEASELDQAIALALPLFPELSQKTLVVFSDQQFSPETRQRAERLLRRWDGRWQEIRWPTLPPQMSDVRLLDFALPSQALPGEQIIASLLVESMAPGQFQVRLERDGERIAESLFSLAQPGQRRIYLPFRLACGSGRQVFQASVETRDWPDLCPENNVFSRGLTRTGQRRMLVIAANPLEEGSSNWAVELLRQPADQFPFSLAALSEYQAIAIVQAQAEDWAQRLPLIEQYVALGGGLLMLGDKTTYSLGGYCDTPVEKALPVWCCPRDNSSLALMIVLDASGTMAQTAEGEDKLTLVKEAIRGLWQNRRAEDEVGLLAFTGNPTLLLSLGRHDAQTLMQAVEPLHASGGTAMLPALTKAGEELRRLSGQRQRQMILFSDGFCVDEKAELLRWAHEFSQTDIALSVIGVGQKVNGALLESLAQQGGGQFYPLVPQRLPASMIENLRRPRSAQVRSGRLVAQSSPFLRGSVQALEGITVQYHATEAKPWAQVLLQSERADPVLALGYYGLGRCAALTAFPSPAWMAAGGEQLLGDLCHWLTESTAAPFSSEIQRDADGLRLTLHIPSAESQRHNRLLWAHPSWTTEVFPLPESGPGVYTTRWPAPSPGAHLVIIAERHENDSRKLGQVECPVPYAQEYERLGLAAEGLSWNQARPSAPRPAVMIPKREGPIFWITATLFFFLLDLWLENRRQNM